jgi:hypothetical protein
MIVRPTQLSFYGHVTLPIYLEEFKSVITQVSGCFIPPEGGGGGQKSGLQSVGLSGNNT